MTRLNAFKTLDDQERYREIAELEVRRQVDRQKRIAKNLVKIRSKHDREAILRRPFVSIVRSKPPTKPTAVSATERWRSAIALHTDRGIAKSKAVVLANRENRGLRESMLAEVNSR